MRAIGPVSDRPLSPEYRQIADTDIVFSRRAGDTGSSRFCWLPAWLDERKFIVIRTADCIILLATVQRVSLPVAVCHPTHCWLHLLFSWGVVLIRNSNALEVRVYGAFKLPLCGTLKQRRSR